ncbi:hypothetical protein AQI88_25460 [Streptomyces cellostaticus]|uniref:Uncharacterized protein n=1 Tax=Streptomyces cellostaticus TaxID=67285 RepID=A0A117PV46_9ACTN|nr:hypothetical protein AQI88_25460 [Streptomyces cellostaticus]
MHGDAEVIGEGHHKAKPPAPARLGLALNGFRTSAPAVAYFDTDQRTVADDCQTELASRRHTVQDSVRR